MLSVAKLKGALVLLFALWATSAQAYIGPGVGAGVLATVLTAIATFFLALFAIIYYPIKRFLKTRRKRSRSPTDRTE
jgi:hypothetical protein